MAIVGFNFTKITAEKKAPVKGKISIVNNVGITSIEKADISLGTSKQCGLRYTFEYSSKYEPKVGSIVLEGEILAMEDDKKCDEIIKIWKDKKQVQKEAMTVIVNKILSKSNIQALVMSNDVGLPPSIPLPKVKVQTPNK